MIVRFNGLDLADETKYLITGITGWDDMPEVVSGSAVRPRRHGSWPGGLLAPRRVVTLDLEILGDSTTGNSNLEALTALRKAMALDDTERALTIDFEQGLGPEEINCRVTSLILPMSAGYSIRRSASIEFAASDPRRYAADWTAKTFGTRTRSVVPVYPVRYPKKYQTYGKPGDLTAINEGGINTPPVFTITGPIIRPGITITDSKGTRKISFDLTLGAGKRLVVDVQNGTARQGATSYYGDTRGALLEDMVLRPGTSTIHFTGSGNTSQLATLNVAWRSANL